MDASRVLVAGETLVDLFPDGPGDLDDVDGFRHRAGGAPANVAAALSRLDAPPLFWTRLGGDPFGDFLAGRLAAHGLDGEYVVRGDADTALAVVSPTPDGDRSFSFYAADTATFAFDAGAVPDAVLRDCECVHVGGVALADPRGRAATLDLAARARDADCVVSVDPNARPALHDTADARAALRDLLALADVACASADDLAVLGGDRERASRDPEAAAAALLADGPETAFLTLGGDGAVAVTDAGGERVARSQSAFDVDVVDATGAGDAFTAGVLARYERAPSADALADALRWGCAAGALATTATGGLAALPDRAAVRELAE
ncbi:carbohydrate kinase family protein [Halobacterium yunchengense]|uniref:carbohydrate kinase family protein n=1 Tax=Halobacterium yunchengense TaxID=3108497 RepID=UPI00300AED81